MRKKFVRLTFAIALFVTAFTPGTSYATCDRVWCGMKCNEGGFDFCIADERYPDEGCSSVARSGCMSMPSPCCRGIVY